MVEEESSSKKNENDKRKEEQEVDKGYSWIVLTGSYFIYLFVLGSMKCFGVLYTEMLVHFSAGSGNTAWIGSIAWFLLLSMVPVANVLTRRFSFRLVAFVGGVMVGCGYLLSGFVKQMELMYLTFAIAGLGLGLSYTPCAAIINYYFNKRRTLANGIMVSSGGIAVLSFPFLYRFLIDKYGLSQAFWIIGAILSNICVACCVYRQPKSLLNFRTISLPDDGDSHQGHHKSIERLCGTLNLQFSLFKNRRFTLLVIALTLCTIGHVNNYILIPAHIKALGYSNNHVTLGVSITGGAELIARIVVGWFADLNIIKKIYIFVICTFVGGIFALISPLFNSFTFMAIYAAVAAAFPASFLALLAVLAIERVGMDNFQPAFAFISVFMAIASVISLPISGSLADYHGNWYPSFLFTGITLMSASAVALLEQVISRFGTSKRYWVGKGKTHSLQNVDIEIVAREMYVESDNDNVKENISRNQENVCEGQVYINAIVGNDNKAFQEK